MNGAYAYKGFPQRPFPQNNGGDTLVDLSGDAMSSFMADGPALDDMVMQNEKAARRQSMPVYGGSQMAMGSPDSRRMSMLQFGDGTAMDDFQFDGSMDGLMRNGTFPRTTAEIQNDPLIPPAAAELAINTQFSNGSPAFSTMPAYGSPLHPNANLDMEMTSPYPNMPLPMDDALMMTPSDMTMFPTTQFPTPMINSPVAQDFTALTAGPPPEPATSMPPPDQYRSNSSSATPDTRSKAPTRTSSQDQISIRSGSRPQSEHPSTSTNNANQMVNASLSNQEPVGLPTGQDVSPVTFNQMKFPWTVPPGGFPSTMNANPHMKTQFKNIYSSTGFDMLGVLMRVATRPNPQIDIGSVDLSCAFVVCDAEKDDQPIVYCSENFERLTGYTKHMILGRNCRFLQSPDGKVEPGIKRRYVDDESVYYLKQMTMTKQEAQISLINYRRGGQPFMNLLTMIPIAWDSGNNIKFIVGFQVDLVEQPGAMTNKNPDGSYRVNYQRGISMPTYVFSDHKPQPEQGQTISKDEVSNVLATYGSTGDSEITRRIWDKVLLENTDDVVHVLSLKGLFLYLSPSSNRILEYDPSELVGTALSSVCHPSDIVPVTRELKETNSGASVNVVFRIRRKKSGYMWFEGHGSLHTEQGKGRKCIILVGRERPVYTLSKSIVRASGGIGDNELWSKMSTSGMFLFVSSNVRSLLDRQPEELVGTSIQLLMRLESREPFSRILELARTGRKGEVKHEMSNRRGQVLQAFTTLYPGDAVEGQKPTFLVAQTRLLKYSRNSAGQRPGMTPTQQRNSGDSHASLHSGQSSASPHPASQSNTGSGTPHTTVTDSRFVTTEGSAATFSGQHGLQIGHQDHSLASDDNVFDELKTTRNTSWQYELRQMEKRNRYLAEEVQSLLAAKKKRKRRKGAGQLQKDCANCHTKTTPEWRRGPSGNRDLCNSCGLRWAKQQGRVSPRTSSVSDKSKKSVSPRHTQNILPNVMSEPGRPSSISSALAQPEKKAGQQDAHAPKVARTEAAATSHYSGATSNIPPKIEEASEPN